MLFPSTSILTSIKKNRRARYPAARSVKRFCCGKVPAGSYVRQQGSGVLAQSDVAEIQPLGIAGAS